MTFHEFWAAYPKKVARMMAERNWNRLTPAQQAEAMEGLSRYRAWLLSRGVEPAYILHASTYLHQQRWTDDYDMPEEVPAAQWWKSEPATLEMARKVGIVPAGGEGWDALRSRIRGKLVRLA